MTRRMARMLAVTTLLVTLVGLAADLAWGQGLPGRRRPAREGPQGSQAQGEAGARARPAERGLRGGQDGDRDAPVTVDADHLETLQKEGVVIFSGSVIARQNSSTQYADRMEVYLDAAGDRITRTVSTGNVRIITRDCRTGTAKRAEYYDAEQRVLLIGNARVWQDDSVVTGERITMYLAEDRSVVEGGKQERVKAVFHPKREEQPRPDGAPVAAPAPCK
jgi:lipopolysaccharide export system protein LptA